MVSVACNQKSIKEFTEHHDSKFISMKEFYPYIQMLTLGQSQGSVKGSWGIRAEQGGTMGAVWILKMTDVGSWSLRERRHIC